MNTLRVLVAIVAGIAAGALSGILFAPAKGRKTRKRLLTKGKNYSGVIKKRFNKFGKAVDDVLFYDNTTVQTEYGALQDSQII